MRRDEAAEHEEECNPTLAPHAKQMPRPPVACGGAVEEDDVDDLLRGLTEIRFTIRKTSLKSVVDEELESGMPSLTSSKPEVRIGYFSYLLMAEIQERLIEEIA